MFKSISLAATLLLLPFSASAQMQEKKEIPNLRLTLTTEKTTWSQKETAPVKVTIESLSEHTAQVPATIYFRLDGRARGDERMTKREAVFWSPVTVTNTYAEKATTCQNNLTKDSIQPIKDTNLVMIHPPSNNLYLRKGEKREFSFNLAGMCWNHSMSSVYPDQNIFQLARPYFISASYKLYFELHFDGGMSEENGILTPITLNLKSNEVRVVIQ